MVYGQSRYNIVYESRLGPYSASENITSINHIWAFYKNRYIPQKIGPEKRIETKAAGLLYRMAQIAFLEFPLAFALPTFHHEQYGHGFRIQEFNGYINRIYVPFPPYQDLGGYITYSIHNITRQQKIAISMAGSEANTILSQIIRKNILLDDTFNYHNALLYLYSNNDLSGYSLFAYNRRSSDVRQYITEINAYYGKENLSSDKLRWYAILSMATDPLNYNALYSIFKGFLWDGTMNSPMVMIPIANRLKYLPKFRFIFTPYGVELAYQHYLKYKQQLYSAEFSHSDGIYGNAWRLKLAIWNIHLYKRMIVNTSFQVWHQPPIKLYHNTKAQIYKGLGTTINTTLNYDIIQRSTILGVVLKIGYKTDGFIEGETLSRNFSIIGGVSFKLLNKQ